MDHDDINNGECIIYVLLVNDDDDINKHSYYTMANGIGLIN